MYDIFFISDNTLDSQFINLKERFPLVKLVKTYDEAKKRAFTKFFWIVWPDLIVDPNFNFDYTVSSYDVQYVHVFKNKDYYDGICLIPKHLTISQREIEYRFFITKKEIDIQASTPKPFDIVFISYTESQADQNYKILKARFSRVNRVHGVKGIHQAHIAAAKLSTTEMFWVVDADAILESDFNFEFPQVVHHDTYTKSTVHVWKSRNPINGLIYGYGGVKLLPKKLTLEIDITTTDMTTSISKQFKAMPTVSNITAFNTDPFSTWRSAFRECVKLTVNADNESIERLTAWCALNETASYGFYAHLGALAGRAYGEKNASNKEALSRINDFTWLEALWLAEKSQLSHEHMQ
jgi:hypothetical protein